MIRSGFQCRKSADIWRCAPPRHWERLVPFAEIPPERVHRDRKLGPDLIPGVVGSTQKLLKLFHVANLTPFRKRSDLSWVGTSPAASNDFAQRLDLRLYKHQLVYPQAKSHANAEVEQFNQLCNVLQHARARTGIATLQIRAERDVVGLAGNFIIQDRVHQLLILNEVVSELRCAVLRGATPVQVHELAL